MLVIACGTFFFVAQYSYIVEYIFSRRFLVGVGFWPPGRRIASDAVKSFPELLEESARLEAKPRF